MLTFQSRQAGFFFFSGKKGLHIVSKIMDNEKKKSFKKRPIFREERNLSDLSKLKAYTYLCLFQNETFLVKPTSDLRKTLKFSMQGLYFNLWARDQTFIFLYSYTQSPWHIWTIEKCSNHDFLINLSPSTHFSPLLLYLGLCSTLIQDLGKGDSFKYFCNAHVLFL